MGVMYSEDDELDYTFLQSVRQKPQGAAPRRRVDEGGRDRMADLVSQGQQVRSRSIQDREVSRGGAGDRVAREQAARRGRTGNRGIQEWEISRGRAGDQGAQEQAARRGRTGDQGIQIWDSQGGRAREEQSLGGQARTIQGRGAAARTPERQLDRNWVPEGQRKADRNRAVQNRSQTYGAEDGRHGRVQSQGRQGQAGARRPLTMQEKQRLAALMERKKRRLRRQRQMLAILLGILLAGTGFAVLQLRQLEPEQNIEEETGGQSVSQMQAEGSVDDVVLGTIQGIPESQYSRHPEWTEDYLTVSEYSRPGDPLTEVKNIFVHYTANPNTSAAQNRSYFENLKDNHDVPGASAHFIIGINGEILQIVPLDEIAYAVQTRNEDSISIECCFKNKNGQFTQETYDSLIELLAWLVSTYELETEDILRHYDCGGKKCPLYYVDHEDAWRILKQDVAERVSSSR